MSHKLASSPILTYPAVYSNAFLTLLNVREYMAGIWDNNDWVADWNTIHPSQIPDVESFRPTTRTSAVQTGPVSMSLESCAVSTIIACGSSNRSFQPIYICLRSVLSYVGKRPRLRCSRAQGLFPNKLRELGRACQLVRCLIARFLNQISHIYRSCLCDI